MRGGEVGLQSDGAAIQVRRLGQLTGLEHGATRELCAGEELVGDGRNGERPSHDIIEGARGDGRLVDGVVYPNAGYREVAGSEAGAGELNKRS